MWSNLQIMHSHLVLGQLCRSNEHAPPFQITAAITDSGTINMYKDGPRAAPADLPSDCFFVSLGLPLVLSSQKWIARRSCTTRKTA